MAGRSSCGPSLATRTPFAGCGNRRRSGDVNQLLAAGLIDGLRLHVVPVLLGAGERPLEGASNTELEPLGRPHGTTLVTHLGYPRPPLTLRRATAPGRRLAAAASAA
jgi:hypothetical protein